MEKILVIGHASHAEGIGSKVVPTGKCKNPVSEELKKEIEKDPKNPIKKCVFHKGTDDCYFAGECENKIKREDLNMSEDKNKELTLDEAFKAARKGNFVTNEYFSEDQSMHYWNGKFYYEDGAIVTKEFLETQDFATKGRWFICIPAEKVDKERLNKVHIDAKGMMLYTKAGYQQCVLK